MSGVRPLRPGPRAREAARASPARGRPPSPPRPVFGARWAARVAPRPPVRRRAPGGASPARGPPAGPAQRRRESASGRLQVWGISRVAPPGPGTRLVRRPASRPRCKVRSRGAQKFFFLALTNLLKDKKDTRRRHFTGENLRDRIPLGQKTPLAAGILLSCRLGNTVLSNLHTRLHSAVGLEIRAVWTGGASSQCS